MVTSSFKKRKLRLILSLGFSYILKTLLSISLGIITAQFQLFDNFSPFMIILLSVAGKTGLIPSFCYLGSAIGLLTAPFSYSAFKYITALSMLYVLHVIRGRKTREDIHFWGVWSGIICLTSGILFMLPTRLDLFNVLLLITESALICCCDYFILYSAKAIRKNRRLSGQEMVALMISIIVVLVFLKDFTIASLNIAHISSITLLLLGIHFLKFNRLILFSTIIGMIVSVMNQNGEELFLGFTFGAIFAAIILHFNNRLVSVSFTIPYYFILFLYGNFPWNYQLFIEPMAATAIVGILPKKRIKQFLCNYIEVRDEMTFLSTKEPSNTIEQCKNGCKKYCNKTLRCYKKNIETINSLIQKADNSEQIAGEITEFCCHPAEMEQNILSIIEKKQIACEMEMIDELHKVALKFENKSNHKEKTLKIHYNEEKSLKSELKNAGVPVKDISITSNSNHNKKIYLIIDAEEQQNLIPIIKKAALPYLSSPYCIQAITNNNDTSIEIKETARYKAECAALSLSKSSEKASGDTAVCFSTDQNNFFLIISDGMGSGKNAELASNSTVEAIKNILKAGFSTPNAIAVFQSLQGIYCPGYFSTIDLCHINFQEETASFYKIGASNSYHIQDKCTQTIQGGGLPLGICEQEACDAIVTNIQPGDYIVMSSDGASQLEENIPTIKKNQNAKHVAEQLIRAVISDAKQAKDDVTVLVCRIDQNTPSAS